MSEAAQIESVPHGVGTLDAATQLLKQVTQMNAPAAMIRGMAQPLGGWIEDTRRMLDTAALDEDDAEDIKISLFSLDELNKVLLEKMDAGEAGWALFVIADAMEQTTEEMCDVIWKDGGKKA